VPPTMCDVWSPSRDGELPDKVDLRPYMTDVEDQSNSNSCCANAVAGAYEYLCKRKAMESGDSVGDISRLFIYYVGRKHDQMKWGEDTSKVINSMGGEREWEGRGRERAGERKPPSARVRPRQGMSAHMSTCNFAFRAKKASPRSCIFRDAYLRACVRMWGAHVGANV